MEETTKNLIVAETKKLTRTFTDVYGSQKADDYLIRETGYLLRILQDDEAKDGKLHKCSPASIRDAMRDVVLMGLSLNPTAKQVALVPRWDKKLTSFVANYQTMYRGDRDFLVANGIVKNILPEVVYANDVIEHYTEIIDGKMIQKFKHVPVPFGDRGELIGAYAIVEFQDGTSRVKIAHKEDIDKRRKIAETDMVWSKWESEMWKKTVVRMAINDVPRATDQTRELLSKWEEQDNQHFDLNKANEPEVRIDQSAFDKLKSLQNSQLPAVQKLAELKKLTAEYRDVSGFVAAAATYNDALLYQAETEAVLARQDTPVVDVVPVDSYTPPAEEKPVASVTEANAGTDTDNQFVLFQTKFAPKFFTKEEIGKMIEENLPNLKTEYNLRQRVVKQLTAMAWPDRMKEVWEANPSTYQPFMGQAWFAELLKNKQP